MNTIVQVFNSIFQFSIYQLARLGIIKFTTICFVCFAIISCQNDQKVDKTALLIGQWQATALVEEQDTLGIDLQAVQLHFHPRQKYNFHGTLKEIEAGTYRIQKDLLFTKDTLINPPHEKVVKILKLTADSLQLEMQDKDKTRILDLRKVK